MKPIGVTICINYLDYLKETYPFNKDKFSLFQVVTIGRDHDTIQYCKDNHIHTHIIYDYDKKGFNKGFLLNSCLRIMYHFFPNDWFLLCDADYILPPHIPNVDTLIKENLYSAQRLLVNTPQQLDAITISNAIDYDIALDIFPLDNRIGDGYCQLFHKKALYNEHYDAANLTDIMFQVNFDAIKEFTAIPGIHLGERRKNWYGRKTIPFRTCKDNDSNISL